MIIVRCVWRHVRNSTSFPSIHCRRLLKRCHSRHVIVVIIVIIFVWVVIIITIAFTLWEHRQACWNWCRVVYLCSQNFTDVDSVNVMTRMLSTHVSTHIRHVFRPIYTIRTVKSRQLAALEFGMIVEIILMAEDTWASRTRKLLLLHISVYRNSGFLIRSTSSPVSQNIRKICWLEILWNKNNTRISSNIAFVWSTVDFSMRFDK